MFPIIHSNFNFQLNYDFDNEVEIWIDNFDKLSSNSNQKNKIFVSIEPDEIIKLNNTLKQYHYLFDYILTYDEELLKNVENARLFEYGTKWVEIEKYQYPNKSFFVSMVCGNKDFTNGHRLRKKVWYKQLTLRKKYFL